ncbi:superoxide dismutase family protein [Ammoniphilus sp. YIM 78166]|uniref:superoxide dismutase family protein n=1 Tax=Ammoniphilus sp. YIM 78166 TaxID=1644106 RepID=UPI001F0EA916|nr:superoxide dismutase family protein [Ammoniphilus sp. YIM 78166]
MKKLLTGVLASSLLFTCGVVSAHGGHAHSGTVVQAAAVKQAEKVALHTKALVNGLEIKSRANHVENGKYYVSVEAFADLFNKSYSVSADKKSVSFNGKTISNVKWSHGEATAWIQDLSSAVNGRVTWDDKRKEAYVLVLPEGTINLEPGAVVPAMGEHWANPAEMPLGPIYGVHEGRLVFLEYMIAQDDFVKGKSYPDIPGMKGLPSPAVVHTDIEFQPVGHPGFEIPHYDIHMYFITDEEQHQIGTVYTELANAKGEKIGYAAFYNHGPQVVAKVVASGLTPNGQHGFHIHSAQIENNDFAKAGGHFNPEGKKHGHDNPEGAHAGDLPNLVADSNGNVSVLIPVNGISLEKGQPNSIYGKSLIIHAGPDDYKTDPAGDSGARIAGGNLPQ